MINNLSEDIIVQALDWAYDKAVNGIGIPGFDSAQKMAEDYLSGDGTLHSKVDSLIRSQTLKAGVSGFVTGLGGLPAMPITIPANLLSVLYLQIQMIAAIAYMGGYDLRNDKVKSLVYACLAANSAKDVLKDIGIVVGTKLTKQAITSISGKTLTVINQKVGFRLLTKFGEKGVINLGKSVPIVGGIIGCTIDVITIHTIGNVAKDVFITT